MKAIQNFCERYGWVMMGFTLLYTFSLSLLYSADMSNHDYLYYMHLAENGDYSSEPLIAGTILLTQPILAILGHHLYLWKIGAWVINCITALIPFFALLNKEQRKKYAYIMVIVLFVFNWRFGLEPPKYVYLLNTIMLTCFIKYLEDNKYGWTVGISILLALIAFVRFPSFLIWPVVVLSMLLLKRNIKHTLTVIVLPLLLFLWFISITNGSVGLYFSDISNYMNESTSEDHSLLVIFLSEVQTTVNAFAYTFILCAPLVFFTLLKVKQTLVYRVLFALASLIAIAIIFIHPSGRLCSCALCMTVGLIYCNCNGWTMKNIVMVSTLLITMMFASTGSNCGFIHDYLVGCFIPFLVANTPALKENKQCQNEHNIIHAVNNGVLTSIFATLSLIIIVSLYVSGFKGIKEKYYKDSNWSFCNAEVVSHNLDNIFMCQEECESLTRFQKEYNNYSKSSKDVIFWGGGSHIMSFANDRWPVTNIWNITSKNKDAKAFKDFKNYIMSNKPIVIDTEKHLNTESFLISLGYTKTAKDGYSVYEP